MTQDRIRTALVASLVMAGTLVQPPAAGARQPPTRQPVESAAPAQGQAPIVVAQDARETRQQLEEILKRLPPSTGRVLRLDPSLLRNEAYLSPYPALAAFLQSHPEVVNNPGYFLENVVLQLWSPPMPSDPRSEAIGMWRNTIEGFSMFMVFLVVTGALVWVIRSLVEWRRWNRMLNVQAEFQKKLFDRLTSNEDLLAYLQTDAGRRGFGHVPVPQEAPAPVRPPGAPLSRILWAIQAGIVLAAGALGLLFVSNRVIEEAAEVFFAVGVLALAVGAGFVVSAGASLLLSRRLGLFDPVTPREHSGPSGA
ncbi:MAG TPA: hypothetical protein VLD67_08720 [Vicinamibacterales bacterium]|nr:hypothetical protein [Vicinamibacterales bacterium]